MIERQDAWVAAVAVTLDLPLVTHNSSHFERVPYYGSSPSRIDSWPGVIRAPSRQGTPGSLDVPAPTHWISGTPVRVAQSRSCPE